MRKPEGWHHPTVGLSAINKFKVRAPALYMYRGCMDETETILKPETKTERRPITKSAMLWCNSGLVLLKPFAHTEGVPGFWPDN